MATPMMPDAPEPQNRMMQPAAMPAQPQAGPNMMQAAPQGAPGGAPQPPQTFTPEEIAEARKHLGAVSNALMKVAAKPRGDLTKKDVFDAASDMISEGGFPTPQSKQSLIVQLANMPDDEAGIRAAIGRMRFRVIQLQSHFHKIHGEG